MSCGGGQGQTATDEGVCQLLLYQTSMTPASLFTVALYVLGPLLYCLNRSFMVILIRHHSTLSSL